MESRWINIHLATCWREAVNCYTADQLQMIQGNGLNVSMIQLVVSLDQNRPVVVVQWLAHLTGIFRVSGPAP